MLHIQVTLPGLILDSGGMGMSFGAHFLKIGAYFCNPYTYVNFNYT